MILFLYKIMIGAYPNPGFDLSGIRQNDRTGITITPKLNLQADGWVRAARGSSFFNRGPKLYNILLKELRDVKYMVEPTPANIEIFKTALDKYLARVPDQPTTEGLHRAALTNSILFQDRYKAAQ